jgi:hypothetical protein
MLPGPALVAAREEEDAWRGAAAVGCCVAAARGSWAAAAGLFLQNTNKATSPRQRRTPAER